MSGVRRTQCPYTHFTGAYSLETLRLPERTRPTMLYLHHSDPNGVHPRKSYQEGVHLGHGQRCESFQLVQLQLRVLPEQS